MRICHIGYSAFPGQGITALYAHALQEKKLGLTVHCIAIGETGETDEEIIDGVKIHRIQRAKLQPLSIARLIYVYEASKIIRTLSLDIVHVYSMAPFAFLLPLLSGRGKLKWIYDVRSSAVTPPLIWFRNRIIQFQAITFDKVIVLSEGIKSIVFGGSYDASIVPLGADFEHFKPLPKLPELQQRLGIAENDKVLIYTGSLDHNRCLERMLEAVTIAMSEIANLKLVMIGQGTGEEVLRHFATEMSIDHNVQFVGRVPFADIPSYLTLATIGLAFIPVNEIFAHQPPLKTVEYMACGLPVVATDTAFGNRIFILNEVNGLLTEDKAQEFASAIVRLVQDVEMQCRFRSTARDSVRNYDWTRIVSDLLIPIYRSLVS